MAKEILQRPRTFLSVPVWENPLSLVYKVDTFILKVEFKRTGSHAISLFDLVLRYIKHFDVKKNDYTYKLKNCF